jgi:uncharacterized integral membrane protein
MGLVRVLTTLVWLVVFVFLLLLAIKNAQPVTVRFYFGLEWATPLILLLLLVFATGAVLGMIACLPPIVRQRRDIAGLRKEMELREVEQKRAESPPPPPLPDIPVV